MTGRGPRPPRWSAASLAWAARRLGTPELPVDAEELFARRSERDGLRRARSWYRRQARAAVRRALLFSPDAGRPGLRPGGRSPFSWLDVKLGLRMLVRSPLLTLTGCAAIATAIGINAGFNEFMGDFFGRFDTPESGGRLVALTNQDLESGQREGRLLEDLARWRAGLGTVERLGAVTTLDVNLVRPDGGSSPVRAAEVSASVFELTGTRPVLGRVLVDSDDGSAAEPVVVLGFGVWQRTLGGDPDVVGTTVRLGEVVHTVVGVVPEDFTFPEGREDVWVNFRHDPGAFAPRSGPSVIAFGRLAPGRSLAEARAEIAQLGARATADHPDTHGRLRPTVLPFAEMVGLPPLAQWALRGARFFFVLLLIAACANVATLVFARNAGREREIAVRNALGAGRGRILTQLFAEAMVLALVSAAVGLAVADVGLRYGSDLFWAAQHTEPPAWFDAGLSFPVVLYSLVLAVVGAGVVGILPGLRATRGGSAAMLRRSGSGSGTLSFGWLPTAVIVVQTSITVALLPAVLAGSVADFDDQLVEASFSAEPYLTARLMVDSEIRRVTEAEDAAAGGEPMYVDVFSVSGNYRITRTLLERYGEMVEHITRRLESEPGVRSVVATSRLPGVVSGSATLSLMRLELDGESYPDRGWRVDTTEADLGLFDVVGRGVVDGRPLTSADYVDDQRVALVNRSFVDELYGGRSPVGRLVRAFRADGDPGRPWTEIVGVVPDDVAGPGGIAPHMYLPRTRPGLYPLKLLVRVDGDAAAFGPRLRALVADAEPGMLLDEVIPLAEMRRSEVLSQLFGVAVMLFVALVTMLLSTTGVYALMSFIVAQRTREIGIRTALGAGAPRVVGGVFRRALTQLSLGVVVGLALVGLVLRDSVAEGATRDLVLSGIGVATVLVVVGLIGCAVPLSRALRVQPMRALSTE